MKQGKANTSPVTNTLQLIPDVPAPEPFGVGDGEAETVLLNGSVVAAPPSVPEREKKYYVIIFQEMRRNLILLSMFIAKTKPYCVRFSRFHYKNNSCLIFLFKFKLRTRWLSKYQVSST